MSITVTKTLLTVIEILWSFTLIRSIIIMFCGKNAFRLASRAYQTAYYPILNLFTMLEIADVSSFLGIFLFVPILNLLILLIMSIKVGKVFNATTGQTIGLVVLPFIFYPQLFNDPRLQYKQKRRETFMALDSARADSINLMTEEEVRKENITTNFYEEEKSLVDSIFKKESDLIVPVDTYRATKIEQSTLDNMDKLQYNDDYYFRPIEKKPEPNYQALLDETTAPPASTNTESNKFVNNSSSNEDVEFIDL